MTVVRGAGRKPNDVMLVGEAPGREEAARGQPFVGRSGQEQEVYLSQHGLTAHAWYRTNVVKEYRDGNPDPTPAQIREWTPDLEAEVAVVQPRLVVAVGRYAARWFLGERADMEAVHGLAHYAGAFDPERVDRAGGAVVIPVYHPALGMYDSEARSVIGWDYGRVADALAKLRVNAPIAVIADSWTGKEDYLDVSGEEMAAVVEGATLLGMDTEGIPSQPWSLQVSLAPGCSMVLRVSRPDFAVGVAAIQRVVGRGALVVLHNSMYDIEMCRAMGLELRDARLWDTMYASYLMRLEPQALKPLAYRWVGMKMGSYEDTVGDVGREKQIAYLGRVLAETWPKPEPRVVSENDGTSRLYTPQSVERRAEAILVDHYSKDDVDPMERWRQVDPELRQMVEAKLGPMPIGTLDDIPLDEAIFYSARDADATLRLYHVLSPELERQGLTGLMDNGMGVLPIFEEMQFNGMPASRSYFAALYNEMTVAMGRLQSRISHRYYGGKPFNPASHAQVGALMRRRQLRGAHKTKTGAMSTGRKSIEHLRHEDEAIASVIEWREYQKLRDSFCAPVLARIPAGSADLQPVRCQIKTTRVHTRRLAAANPNLLGIPVRTDLGRKVRDGFRAPEGEVFGAWDLSQIEMRYMAHLSQDERLCSAFIEGRDIHAETAAEIFGIPLSEVHPMKHRYPAKRAGFGIITNIQGAGLFDQLRMYGCEGWDADKCDDLITRWLSVYPGVSRFLDECRREARRYGMVRDRWGMLRYLAGVWAPDPKVRAEAERAASSHKISGGAQGMLQNSMRWLRPHIRSLQLSGLNVRWVLQIHDELILQFDEDLWELVDALVQEALTQHHGVDDMRVPVEAEGHKAPSWGGLK